MKPGLPFLLPAFLLLASFPFLPSPAPAATPAPGFVVTVLGARGGMLDGNLSAYMIRPTGDDRAILCDAGTVTAGLVAADRAGALDDVAVPPGTGLTRPGYVLAHTIRAYLLSHAHLDHVAGLVIASPDDGPKPIYALPATLHDLSAHLFNWRIWPNFGDAGPPPTLGKYHYRPLVPGRADPVPDTAMTVTAWPLSHGGIDSTAFLLAANGAAILYLGDTGPDAVEGGHRLDDLWRAVGPQLAAHRLKAIIIEASYDDTRPDRLLFGHMTPAWVADTLRDLARRAGGPDTLRGLTVLIGHVKASLATGPAPQEAIRRDLLRDAARDGLQDVRFVIAEQGQRLTVGAGPTAATEAVPPAGPTGRPR
ncbi:3',5'-cyclic-nucleotide phosphodiesterase [Gluconacetobacter takamatsuzukensis]|uniref:3',5'-cyclic-nucleotide phosphodiesterase n=2 Tax=Gluconacetobacter takamatsuzukensis TaxID=1286190 RepID=A0A7W4KFH8_9PROT|nr:3',5'-cyclic-nucleotide phosphodiesterase [Gluconacetobacter takamatsuzukensis]